MSGGNGRLSRSKHFKHLKSCSRLQNYLFISIHSLPCFWHVMASTYGIGAVLAHQMPDGKEQPIGHVSRTLNSAERNYSQLEKEGLSCVYGIKRFYAYLYGHPFTLITDHKPLLGLLDRQKVTSPQASARVRRWSLYMSTFEYTLKFRNTTAHANADALNRLPLPVEPAVPQHPPELVLLADHFSNPPVTADQIRECTRKDLSLHRLFSSCSKGGRVLARLQT